MAVRLEVPDVDTARRAGDLVAQDLRPFDMTVEDMVLPELGEECTLGRQHLSYRRTWSGQWVWTNDDVMGWSGVWTGPYATLREAVAGSLGAEAWGPESPVPEYEGEVVSLR